MVANPTFHVIAILTLIAWGMGSLNHNSLPRPQREMEGSFFFLTADTHSPSLPKCETRSDLFGFLAAARSHSNLVGLTLAPDERIYMSPFTYPICA
jgi:hypothetical protein